MKLLIIGATGRTGQELVKQALARGDEVTVYVRNSQKLPADSRLTVYQGELWQEERLSQAMNGQDAVLLALGNSMTNRNQPLFEQAIPSVMSSMKQAQVKRLVSLSSLGVGLTYSNTRYPYRLGVRTFLKGNHQDHWLGEKELIDSGLDWTTVHPSPLFDGKKTARPSYQLAHTGYKVPGIARTMRVDVATVMLEVLEKPETYQQAIVMFSQMEVGHE
ncbi:TPA: NAD(P)H-binding protein [Streptococcus suis]|nr:NAD(P)H-binding protein [Streptococcus suis]